MGHPATTSEGRLQARSAVATATMLMGPADRLPGEPSAAEIKIARKNSLGLEFALRYPAATALIAQERARQQGFRCVMAETSEEFAARDLPHIYIKYQKLYEYYDSNVDVVVHGRDWRRAVAVLGQMGYRGHVMFKEPDKIMFERQGSSVSVHLHPGVTWNGVPYFEEAELWANAAPSAGGPWLEMTHEYDYLINLAHNVFENYEVSLGDILYFSSFLRRQSIDPERLEAIAATNGWRRGFVRLNAQVHDLVKAWRQVALTGEVPHNLLQFPYRIAALVLAAAFCERIAANVRRRRIRPALREVYAYPAFYALKLRHDLPTLVRL